MLLDRECPVRIHLVRRAKLSGVPGQHFGVALEYMFGDSEVFDLVYRRGLRAQSPEVFAQGRRLEKVMTLSDQASITAAVGRLQEQRDGYWPGRYDPLGRNCEHVARYIVTGREESLQANGAWFLAGLLGVMIVAN